jgi:1-acyl-sn-glycerol-3-phosphate acyltransferase
MCGLRITVRGRPRPRDVLFLANHVTWTDILVLGGITETAFVAKDEIAGWNIVGWLARQARTIFIAREQRSAVRGQAETLRDALATGHAAAFFPEGTTGDGVTLRAFRPSLLAALYPPPRAIRVQPVAIDYGVEAREVAWGRAEHAGKAALRLLNMSGQRQVTLSFLDPLDPADFPDRKALAGAVRERLAHALRIDASAAPETET